MPGSQKFTFQGKEISLGNTTDDLVLELIKLNEGCPIENNSSIHFGKLLGKGVGGQAWEIHIDGYGEKPYVVKVTESRIEKIQTGFKTPVSLETVAEKLAERGYPKALTIALNGNDPNRIISIGDSVCIASLSKPCKTKKALHYEKADGSGDNITIPKGNYVCQDGTYSEYYIGLLCAKLYEGVSPFSDARVKCMNFINVFGFSQCIQPCQMKEYTFMEKIHGTVYDVPLMGVKVYDSIYEQLILALNIMQLTYDIVHGDLHVKNMFLEFIKPKTTYCHQNLYDADFFEYKLGDRSYYVENRGVILKIGDFGLSVKYSDPLVGNGYVLETGMKEDLYGVPVVPNWYSPSYDLMHATHSMKSFLESKGSLGFWKKNELHDSVASKIYNRISSHFGSDLMKYYGRPRLNELDKLDKIMDGFGLLNQVEFEALTKKPSSKHTIALVGEVTSK